MTVYCSGDAHNQYHYHCHYSISYSCSVVSLRVRLSDCKIEYRKSVYSKNFHHLVKIGGMCYHIHTRNDDGLTDSTPSCIGHSNCDTVDSITLPTPV